MAFSNSFNKEEIKLSDDVFEQIKEFDRWDLTEKQKLLIDELILNEELKERYEYYGLCKECKQPNTGPAWCQSCNAKCFQQDFKNWTSGNYNVDDFIQKTQLEAKDYRNVLEWIEYNRFENINYLAKGGFGTVYKAIWKDGYIHWRDLESNQWKRLKKDHPVGLKCFHGSQDITIEFLREVSLFALTNHSSYVVPCYGITKDPETNNFIMVMEYANYGSLRQNLNNHFISMDWMDKLKILKWIASGLNYIHNNGLIHCDLHSGNVLSNYKNHILICDLGLCKPANIEPKPYQSGKIFGVLPYVAPEVLRGKGYIQASDIYAFGIIAYEVCTGLPPYHDMEHDELLVIRICQGLRPKSNYTIPQLILDIIKQCWDADPLKRPISGELNKLLKKLRDGCYQPEDSLIKEQIKGADEINKHLSPSTPSPLFAGIFPSPSSASHFLSYTTHPQAVYTSRLLDFKNLPESKNADDNDKLFETESMAIDFIQFDINSKGESN